MKKLLYLFATIAVVSTGVTPVVACGNSATIPEGKTLPAGLSTDAEIVDQIINKLQGANVTIEAGLDTSINNRDTKDAINNELQAQYGLTNTDISALNYITPPRLEPGNEITVPVTVKLGTVSRKVDIIVVLAQTLQEQAESIKQKVPRNFNLMLPDAVGPDVSTPAATKLITDTLLAKTRLKPSDLEEVTYSLPNGDKSLELGEQTLVRAAFTLRDPSGNNLPIHDYFQFYATRAKTDQEKVAAIQNKIGANNIAVPNGTEHQVSALQTEIWQALQTANPDLTKADQANITYSGPNLVDGKAVDVTAHIKINEASVDVTLAVTMKSSAQETAEATQTETNKIVTTNNPLYLTDLYEIPETPVASTATGSVDAATQQMINHALKLRSKGQLTEAQVDAITYTYTNPNSPNATFPDDQKTELNATIKGTGFQPITFHVWVILAHSKPEDQVKAIKGFIDPQITYDIGLVPDYKLFDDGVTANWLKRQIMETNHLKPAAANYITFPGQQTLKNNQVNKDVNVGIQSQKVEDSLTINVKVDQTLAQYVNSIKDKYDKMIGDPFYQSSGGVVLPHSLVGKKAQDPEFTSFLKNNYLNYGLGFTALDLDLSSFTSTNALSQYDQLQVNVTIQAPTLPWLTEPYSISLHFFAKAGPQI